jgi:membrane protein
MTRPSDETKGPPGRSAGPASNRQRVDLKGTTMLTRLLSTPTAQLGRAGRFAVFQIKLWSHCTRLLKKNRSGQQAAALSYHTVFGIVPLAIVMLLLFQLFPAHKDIADRIKRFIYDQANLSAFESTEPTDDDSPKTVTLTEHLDAIVARFFSKTNKGSITLFSVVIVIWAALALLSTIEKAFNNIWHVARGRNFLQRIINYWALLTLGPLLLGAGIYITTRYSTLMRIDHAVLTSIAPLIVSYLIATAALFLLYFVLPNTKVKARAAIWGAAVAAFVWIGARSAFAYSVTELKLYSTLYGVMALIPMTVLWIYITWLIVLFGLQLTFTTQHLKTLDAAEIAAARKTEEYFVANDLTAINILREIASAFEQNSAPVGADVICSRLNIPGELGEKMLNRLVEKQLIVKTSEPRTGFAPAKDPENIRLSEVSDAVASAGFAQETTHCSFALEQIIQARRDALAKHNLKQILADKPTDAGPVPDAQSNVGT